MKDKILTIFLVAITIVVLIGVIFTTLSLYADCWNKPIAEAPVSCLMLLSK